jgi:hypothetical protein
VNGRERTLRGMGLGLLTTALGIAAQASDLDSAPVQVAAWACVGLGVVVTGLSLGLSRARAQRNLSADLPLSERLMRAGSEVLLFLQTRDAQVPMASIVAGSPFLHPVKARHNKQLERAYDQDTAEMYSRAHAPIVRRLVIELVRAGHLGRNEARGLLAACEPNDFETVGVRLIELGSALSERY